MSPAGSTSSEADEFYGRALVRIRRFMIAISGIGLLVCAILFRWPVTAGFLAGAVISYINHRWLERMVDALGERVTTGESKERGGGIALRALLRYVFIAVGAYVIFSVSLAALYGFLSGVCLPVAAIVCEAAVEVFVAMRRRL